MRLFSFRTQSYARIFLVRCLLFYSSIRRYDERYILTMPPPPAGNHRPPSALQRTLLEVHPQRVVSDAALLQSACCCGRRGCSTLPTMSARVADDTRRRDHRQLPVAMMLPVCRCTDSFQRLVPNFFSVSLQTLSSSEDSSRLGTSLNVSLLTATRSMWPSAMAGFDVVMRVNDRLGVDCLHDDVVAEAQLFLSHNSGDADIQNKNSNDDGVDCPPPPPPPLSLGVSKFDAWIGVLWSVALHVSKLPMLEHRRGPTALILCATPRQCTEVQWLLQPVLSTLKLVAHNVFEPPPLMPEERRADITIATPLMWYDVCCVAPPASVALKKTPPHSLSALYGARRACAIAQPPILGMHGAATAAIALSTKPYQLDQVAQCAVMDVDGIIRTGGYSLLEAIVATHRDPLAVPSPLATAPLFATSVTNGVRDLCQWYFVAQSDASVQSVSHLRKVHLTFKKTNVSAVPVAQHAVIVQCDEPQDAAGLSSAPGDADQTVEPPCKRARVDNALAHSSRRQEFSRVLLLRGCVSVPQMIRDVTILDDIAMEVDAALPSELLRSSLQLSLGILTLGKKAQYQEQTQPQEQQQSGRDCVAFSELCVVVSFRCPADDCSVSGEDESGFCAISSALSGKMLDGNVVTTVVARATDIDHQESNDGAPQSSWSGFQAWLESLTSTTLATGEVWLFDRSCIAPKSFSVFNECTEVSMMQRYKQLLNLQTPLRSPTPGSSADAEGGCEHFLSRWTSNLLAPAVVNEYLSEWVPAADTVMEQGRCIISVHNLPSRWAFTKRERLSVTTGCGADVGAKRFVHAGGRCPSRLEDMLQFCERIAFVRSFVLHENTTCEGGKIHSSLYLEFWSQCAAQEVLKELHLWREAQVQQQVQLHQERGDTNDDDDDIMSLEFFDDQLFYEGAAAEYVHDLVGLPHPLDH